MGKGLAISRYSMILLLAVYPSRSIIPSIRNITPSYQDLLSVGQTSQLFLHHPLLPLCRPKKPLLLPLISQRSKLRIFPYVAGCDPFGLHLTRNSANAARQRILNIRAQSGSKFMKTYKLQLKANPNIHGVMLLKANSIPTNPNWLSSA
jgi:hypothetical protein